MKGFGKSSLKGGGGAHGLASAAGSKAQHRVVQRGGATSGAVGQAEGNGDGEIGSLLFLNLEVFEVLKGLMCLFSCSGLGL